jgi:glutaredoxin
LVVTLYTRPGCHLCELAREAIEGLRDELPPFELAEIDIDRDEGLLARFLERIPVVAVDGRVVSELDADPRVLRARLDTVQR